MPSGKASREKRLPLVRSAGLAALAFCLAAGPARAVERPPDDSLKSLEQQLEADRERADKLERETEALRTEMESLRGELTEAAGKAQDLEEQLSTLEQTLAVLEVEESRASQNLEERRQQMARIVQGLQRLSLVPRESLILSPGSPVELARSGMLLQAAYPKIESEAEALRADLADLASLRADILHQQEELGAAQTALANERERLSGLLARKETLEREASGALKDARERARDLSRQAQDLRELIEKLEEERRLSLVVLPKEKPAPPAPPETPAEPVAENPPAEQAAAEQTQEAAAPPEAEASPEPASQPEAESQVAESQAEEPAAEAQVASLTPPSLTAPPEIRAFPDGPGTLVLPARGSLVRRYNDSLPGATGGHSRGIAIQARDQAQVVAPYDGRVVYAQAFRGYGLILIIEHRGKYHSLLSGLERIDAVEGQWVLAGEPVGVLGSPTSGKPELYLELRRDGQPIDPLPWLAMTSGKVKS